MTAGVLVTLLLAALMHASWNALLHRGADRTATLLVLTAVQGTLGACALPFVTWPTAESLPWLCVGTLIRITYSIVLLHAYGLATFSRIYPIARGAAPLLTAVFAALAGDRLPLRGVAALLAAVSGIGIIARLELRPVPDARALRAGLLAAAMTAAYSVVDGRGVRASPDAFGYAAFAYIGESCGLLLYGFSTRGRPLLSDAARAWRSGIPAGIFASTSYLVALWAFQRAPIALVGAIRETSILFALLIASIALREQLTRRDWLGVLLITLGAAAARF